MFKDFLIGIGYGLQVLAIIIVFMVVLILLAVGIHIVFLENLPYEDAKALSLGISSLIILVLFIGVMYAYIEAPKRRIRKQMSSIYPNNRTHSK